MNHLISVSCPTAIGQRLTRILRGTDTVANQTPHISEQSPELFTTARFGGDEFCVLLTDLNDYPIAAVIADRILKELTRPHDINQQEIRTTVSIGIATSSLPRANAKEMIRDADTAMYRAKHAGKNQCVLFDQSSPEVSPIAPRVAPLVAA